MKTRIQALIPVIVVMMAFLMVANTGFAQKRYRVGYKNQGFSFIPEATILIPSNTYRFGFNMNATFGGCFGSFFAGGGVGLDSYGSDLFVTPFATGRYFFYNDQFSPFAMLDAGYGLPVDANKAIGAGMVITPGFGIRYFMSRSTAVNLALVYRYQSMPIDQGIADASTSLRTNFISSFGLRLGMQF